MPTPSASPAAPTDTGAVLDVLRRGVNPFGTNVAAVGTAAECVQADVRGLSRPQLDDLLQIIDQYRDGSAATRIYTVLGDPGTGKTHLLFVLRSVLRRRARDSGDETLLVIVDRLAPGMDPTDYLLWQVTNFFLENKGEGERLLRAVAGRLAARLLGEALRRLTPHQQLGLIPPDGVWEGLKLRFGSAALAKRRLDRVSGLIAACDRENPTSDDLRRACRDAGVSGAAAAAAVADHLGRTEPNNAPGWFRKELYGRLATLALTGEREPFEELQSGTIEPPTGVREGVNLSRLRLDSWLELLAALSIPVVVVFDQLETYLRTTSGEQDGQSQKAFGQAVTSFIDQVASVCVIGFAEEGIWNEVLTNVPLYSRSRLTQPFALPGKPARKYIEIPARVDRQTLDLIVRARLAGGFPGVDWSSLPPPFPFPDEFLDDLTQKGNTLRECIRKLADRYNSIVFGPPAGTGKVDDPSQPKPRLAVELPGLKPLLRRYWTEQVVAARAEYRDEIPTKVSLIPQLHSALEGWLQMLHEQKVAGTGPWVKVELATEAYRQNYGYLTVIRTEAKKPGLGIAMWLGVMATKYPNLTKTLDFFQDRPCPVKTLVLLRADGEDALTGQSGELVESTRRRRDVRVATFDPPLLHELMAFNNWYQLAAPELEARRKAKSDPAADFREILAEVSAGLLARIDEWRKPAVKEGAGHDDGLFATAE